MTSHKRTIEEQLSYAQVAIDNAMGDATVRSALAAFGYGDERLRQGRTLCEVAQARYQKQKMAYGDLAVAASAFKDSWQQAQETYARNITVARVALQDQPDAARKLRLDGHSGRRATWLAQARQFYANALADPALLSGLAAFGVTQASLEDGAREVEAMAARYAARQQRKGDAQDTTRTRDEALAALARWMHNFAAIARMALKDRPQQLEKLGLALRATPRPAARQRQVV